MKGPQPAVPAGLLPDLEPPPRPYTKGTGSFVTAGVLFAAAVGEHVAAHSMLARRCVRPVVDTQFETDEAQQFAAECTVTLLQAGALKLHASINGLASIGVATAAASIRARYDAYEDVFGRGRHKQTQQRRTVGAALLGVGATAWLAAAVGTWAGVVACTDLPCVENLRWLNTGLSMASTGMVAVGSGLLTYGMLYERRHAEYSTTHSRIQQMRLLPTADQTSAGLVLTGQF